MTDRLKGVIVTFDEDIREDDAEAIINAIRMIKCVASVTPSIRNSDDIMNRMKVKDEFTKDLYDLIKKWNKT